MASASGVSETNSSSIFAVGHFTEVADDGPDVLLCVADTCEAYSWKAPSRTPSFEPTLGGLCKLSSLWDEHAEPGPSPASEDAIAARCRNEHSGRDRLRAAQGGQRRAGDECPPGPSNVFLRQSTIDDPRRPATHVGVALSAGPSDYRANPASAWLRNGPDQHNTAECLHRASAGGLLRRLDAFASRRNPKSHKSSGSKRRKAQASPALCYGRRLPSISGTTNGAIPWPMAMPWPAGLP